MTNNPECKLELRDIHVEQLRHIADLIRGDWSGGDFDGRDVRDWIYDILDGKIVQSSGFYSLIKEHSLICELCGNIKAIETIERIYP